MALFLMSCNNRKLSHEEELMNAVIEVIDSNAFPEKIIAVMKSSYDYKDHHLYYICVFRDNITPDLYPYKVREVKDKIVFFYSLEEEKLPEEPVDEIIEKYYDRGYNAIKSNTIFFFAKCKTTDKKLLYHAANEFMLPCEIPEIRDFYCSSEPDKKQAIEIITEYFHIHALDYNGLGSDTISKHPYRIDLMVYVYNRTDSCLFFDGLNTSLGEFMLMKENDTLRFSPSVYYGSRIIDDPTLVEDPQRILGLQLSSDEDVSFFDNINPDCLHDNLTSLIRDSLYYFPNKDAYELSNTQCLFPKSKIQIITVPEIEYRYVTPSYTYLYFSGRFADKRKQ